MKIPPRDDKDEEIAMLRWQLDRATEALRARDGELEKLRIIAKRRPGSALDLAVEIANLRREFYILQRHLMEKT